MKLAGIQSRVMLIALLPALILAVSLTYFHTRSRMAEIEQAVLDKGAAVARHLAPGSEFGVVTGNDDLLRSIAESALQDKDFTRVTIRDQDGLSILDRRRGRFGRAAETDTLDALASWMHPMFSTNPLIVPITAPIYRIRIQIADDFASDQSIDLGPQIVGWIDIELSLLNASRNQLVVLLESLSIVFAALLAAAVAGRYVGRGVVGPVLAITNAVRRITLGDLDARVSLQAGGELGQLESGINQMAQRVSISHNELQAEIARATRDLKSTLAELERRNLELDDARREAVRVSEFKSQFLANVSHEIRTPMNAILGFTELLARTNQDPVQKEFLDTILASADNLLTLLNDILDLSKIESGRMQLDAVECNIGTILNEVYQLFLPQALQNNVEFFVRGVDPSLSGVIVDPLRLKQVLVNLVSNALKFTDDGYVLLKAQVNSATPSRIDVEFAVEDTGCGIAQDTQRKLFHAFSQGDMSVSRSHGGTGLGLHIASELVFIMGGEISVDSSPGLGSTFSFSLSLPRDPHAMGQPPLPASTPPILLVNPFPPFQEVLRHFLTIAGFEVVTVDAEEFDPTADFLCVLDYWTSKRSNTPGAYAKLESLAFETSAPRIAWVCGAVTRETRNSLSGRYHACVSRTPDIEQTRNSLRRALDRPAMSDEQRKIPEAGTQSGQRNSRLLVVDDHPLNLKLVRSLLEGTGYEVLCMQDSPEALRIAQQKFFDAILLDIHMPHLDGFAMTRQLRREDSACRDSVIIALTADAYSDTAQQAHLCGMNDVLVKPINQQRLLAMIDAWLEGDAASATGRGSAPEPQTPSEHSLAEEMLVILRRMLPEHREQIVAAHNVEDWTELKQQVHKLRGAASYCGVPRLTQALSDLQSLLTGPPDAGAIEAQYLYCLELIDEQIAAAEPVRDQNSG